MYHNFSVPINVSNIGTYLGGYTMYLCRFPIFKFSQKNLQFYKSQNPHIIYRLYWDINVLYTAVKKNCQ